MNAATEQLRVGVDNILYKLETHPQKHSRSPGTIIPVIYVPTQMRTWILRQLHDTPYAGHRGERAMVKKVRSRYFWPRLTTDVKTYVSSCDQCQRRKGSRRLNPRTTYTYLPPSRTPFYRITVDVLDASKRSASNNKYIITFTDTFTKMVLTFATRNQTAQTIARLLVNHICYKYGVPAEILSDNGPCFAGELYRCICQFMGIRRIFTTPYHPQTNGQVERFNRTMIDMMATTIMGKGNTWDQYLAPLEWAYNTSVHPATGETPFFLLHGYDPRMPFDILSNTTPHIATFMNEMWDYEKNIQLSTVKAHYRNYRAQLSDRLHFARRTAHDHLMKYNRERENAVQRNDKLPQPDSSSTETQY
jgi:transposase InsO family protein